MTRPILFVRLLLILMAFVAPSRIGSAQVSVAPTALFLSEQERFGAIYVANQSTTPQEITVGFQFGYPSSDSLGNVFMEFADSLTEATHSIASSLRAFPQRFVLPPGETQTVRLMAQVPGDLPEGMYWTRVLTTSTPQQPFADTTASGIQTRMIFRLQQVTALFFKVGAPAATVAIERIVAQPDSQGVSVVADLAHDGKGPYFGNATVRIYGEAGTLIQEKREALATYVDNRRRFAVALPEGASGTYTAELTLSPDRTDLPAEHRLRTAPVSRTTRFTR